MLCYCLVWKTISLEDMYIRHVRFVFHMIGCHITLCEAVESIDDQSIIFCLVFVAVCWCVLFLYGWLSSCLLETKFILKHYFQPNYRYAVMTCCNLTNHHYYFCMLRNYTGRNDGTGSDFIVATSMQLLITVVSCCTPVHANLIVCFPFGEIAVHLFYYYGVQVNGYGIRYYIYVNVPLLCLWTSSWKTKQNTKCIL